MALSKTVTKISVTNPQSKLYIITLQLTITDTAGLGFTKQYSKEYRTGENVSTKTQAFINAMQDDIDSYKNSQAIYNNASLDTAVNNILGGIAL